MSSTIDEQQDQMESGIGPEDVSSIYPLETHECYYNYENRNDQKRNESTSNLNELLECLNKSGIEG